MKALSLVMVGLLLFQNASPYPWKERVEASNQLRTRVAVPSGYERVSLEPASLGHWLRDIPVKQGRPKVLLFDGRPKVNQSVHEVVLDIDTGNRDLQQCADAVMRLRSEYLFSQNRLTDIRYHFTNGFMCDFDSWRKGCRVRVNGNQVRWEAGAAAPSDSHKTFRQYMSTIFSYCGTASLAKEMVPVKKEDLQAGDVFILPGSPGHAVIVMDVALHAQTGEKIFLLAQSYMPAQDMHVLKNLHDEKLSPWYSINFGSHLETPEWTFAARDLKRFR